MIRVGVLRGGISDEYEVSLKTGGHILSHLRSNEHLSKKYKPLDILIDKEGVWHLNGLITNLEKLSRQVDVVINSLHGEFGEDGQIQRLFEHFAIPYTGSSTFSSALAYNKHLAKNAFNSLGLKTPAHILLPVYQEDIDGEIDQYALQKAHEISRKIPPPWIVKPYSGGSSVGIQVCKSFPSLIRAIYLGCELKKSVLIEEFISGKEASVGVIDNFRGKKTYVLPPTEIKVPKDKEFFDVEMKTEICFDRECPGKFKDEEKKILHDMSVLIHEGLNLDHYSRVDFIVSPTKGIYVLEVNSVPGFTEESIFPHALESTGISIGEFLEHLIDMGLSRYRTPFHG